MRDGSNSTERSTSPSKSVDDDEGEDFTTVHLVPGIEYAISDDLDFVAEAGFSLNDDGSHYVSVGLSYYIR